MSAEEREDRDLNRDPITDETGAHPVGTGVGATGGAAAGAAVGAIGGPVGMVIGGAIGAVVGGLAGKAAAERINPTAEEAHWREHYTREPYFQSGRTYDDYGPAYRLGVTGGSRYQDLDWTSVEPRLASEWESTRGNSTLNWSEAQHASRAAWDRVQSQLGDSMGDDSMRGASMGSSTMGTSSMGTSSIGGSTMAGDREQSRMGSHGSGAAAIVGEMQSAGDNSGDTGDVIDVLKDLVECSKDGEHGFRACAEQAKRPDLKSAFLRHADECRNSAQELNQLVQQCGGTPEQGGSAMGAMHRGWVAMHATLSTYDDKAVLADCERGEDNAKARFRKALDKPLPPHIRQVVERMMQGVERNHDEIKRLRDSM